MATPWREYNEISGSVNGELRALHPPPPETLVAPEQSALTPFDEGLE